jgi:HK97 family phage portal protein
VAIATPGQNPLRGAWNAFWGLSAETKAAAPPPAAPPELRSLVFSPGSYPDAAGDYWNPLLTQVFGGYTAAWNSAVYACLKTICYAFQEAPPKVYRLQADGTELFLEEHRLMELLADPHPSLSGPELSFWVQYCKQVDGNAYLRKIRNRAGEVVQLWPISPSQMSPETSDADAAAGVFISHYVYDNGKGKHEEVPVSDVVHFRLGVDDADHRKGLSNLRRLLREISSDEEATRFTDDLLRNFAVSSLAVTVPPGPVLTEEQAEAIRDRLREAYSGANRGHLAVLGNGATLQQIGFNPQQLDLKAAHQIPETRICAVLGVPAMLVGLSAGLEHTIYNNMEQAQEHLYEQTVVPLWRADAATLTKQLLRPDFDADPAVRLKYDLDDVRALQEDMDERYARLSVAVEKGWVTKDEARAEVGLEPLPDGLGEAQDPMELLRATAEARGGPGSPAENAPGGDGQKALEQKQRSLAYVPELLAVLQALNRPLVEQDLEAYFAGQAERVMAAAKREG